MTESNFWKNKPVMKCGNPISSEIIKLDNKKIYDSDIETSLPQTLKWQIYKKSNDEICNFLNKFYDTINTTKIVFTNDLIDFLIGDNNVILCVVVKETQSICGLICGSIDNMVIFDKIENFCNVMMLCVDYEFRNKKLSQILINELSRFMFKNHNISHGIFESKTKISMPVTTVCKYIRPLNYKKLIELKFISTQDKDIEKMHKKFLLNTSNIEYVPMKNEYLDDVYKLYLMYMQKFNIHKKYTKDVFSKKISNNVVKTYVIIQNDKIIDFASYIPIKYETNDNQIINVGSVYMYSLLNEVGDVMINNIMKIMLNDNMDAIIMNDTMNGDDILIIGDEDKELFDKIYEHRFIKRDKKYLNLFNWQCEQLPSCRISYFLL